MVSKKEMAGRAAKSPVVEPWTLPAPAGYPRAVKRMIAHQIERELARQNISRVALAKQMNTSRAAVNRLLDPENHSVTLQTLERISEILGRKLQVFISD